MNTKLNKLRALGLAALALLTFPRPALADVPPQMFGVNVTGGENGIYLNEVYGFGWFYPSDADLDYLKSKGAELVRVPFRWERVQPTPGGPLSTAEMNQLSLLMDRIEKHGMRIIPDMHNYGQRRLILDQSATAYQIGSPEVTQAHFQDVWNKLANAWKDRGCIWGYDIMNEPNTGSYSWKDAAQAAVNGIRAVDMKNAILIPGDKGSSASAWTTYSNTFNTLVDPANNLIFQAHQYFDKSRQGIYAVGTYEGELATDTIGVTLISNFVNWCNTNGVRGFLGEFGIPYREKDDLTFDTRWNTLQSNVLANLQTNGMSGTYWAGGAAYVGPTTVKPRPNSDTAGTWGSLVGYASGAGTDHFPKFTWFHDAIAAGEYSSYQYPFVSTGGTCAFTVDAVSTYNGSAKSLHFAFTIPSGGWGGGGLHLADNVSPVDSKPWNLPGHVAAGHVLSFYAKGTAGTSLTVKFGSASISSTGINTGALTSSWVRYEIPLTSFLNANVTATTKVPRVMFDVYPRNNVASDIYIDEMTVGEPSTNTAPTISVDTSTGGSTFSVGQSVTLVATAADTGGSIDYVEFFVDNRKIAIDPSSPYQTTTSFPAAGTYKVTAITFDNYGVVAQSVAKTLTITAGPPAVPSGAVATPGNARVLLSWTSSPGATSYNVKRATVSGGPYTTVNSPATNSWTDTGRTNNTTYYYVVSAVNGSGESANSAQVSATPQAISLIKDNTDASGVTFSGTWTLSTSTPGAYGGSYHTDGNTGITPPTYKSVTYTPTITVAGNYRVYARWTAGANRATNVPMDVVHSGGTATSTQNETLNNNTWMLLGTYYLNAGTTSKVIIRNNGADNNVIADAVKFDLY